MQFDSVEEFGRQLDFAEEASLPPVPFTSRQQHLSYSAETAAVPEPDDLSVSPANPMWLPRVIRPEDREQGLRWAFADPQGPRRVRPCVPLAPAEPDPHQRDADYLTSRKTAMTGAHLSLAPSYRRKPPYVTLSDGRCVFRFAEDAVRESRMWALCFVADARRCFVRSHIHRCQNTCFKRRGSTSAEGKVRICRFGFHHEHHMTGFARRPAASQCTLGAACACLHETLPDGTVREHLVRAGPFEGMSVHPRFCPARVQAGQVRKFLRQGKELVRPVDRDSAFGIDA